jgi:hypothetical protein
MKMNKRERRGVYKLNEFISASHLLCSFIKETPYQLNSGYILLQPIHINALREPVNRLWLYSAFPGEEMYKRYGFFTKDSNALLL